MRNSIAVRKACDQHDQIHGLVEAGLAVHCGPTLAGEFARTLSATNLVRHGRVHRLDRKRRRPQRGACADKKDTYYFTRARPYKSDDNAHVEQIKADVVPRHAFRYR
ncbi:hypothetical protein QEH68_17840 [Paenarthrobacter sp. OM7]|uniref:hypothetical protein n=1 Tax=Paenarthrobacter sp. OM7 TaxID=3041264 RepID=UPI0024698249|nr:hypothetical protein [Paenarthrobacter sp. OM7]WGM19863.1 hypothetical protein QEH68_17840 [Paenarthrobacter sp. OM7]